MTGIAAALVTTRASGAIAPVDRPRRLRPQGDLETPSGCAVRVTAQATPEARATDRWPAGETGERPCRGQETFILDPLL